MFRIEDYIDSLTLKLLNSFGERLTYIGLQVKRDFRTGNPF